MNSQHCVLARTGEETMRKFRSLSVAVVFFVIALGLAPLAIAQTPYDPQSPPDLDEFRRELSQVLQELEQHRAMLRQNPLVRDALAKSELKAPPPAQVQQQLQQMSYEDLAQLHKAFATAFPQWREAPQALGKLAAKIGGQPSEGEASRQAKVNAGEITPNAITPDNCQDGFNAAPSWTDWGVTKAFAIAAQAAYEAIPPPLNIIALAAWLPL